jgi:hypothetical protein
MFVKRWVLGPLLALLLSACGAATSTTIAPPFAASPSPPPVAATPSPPPVAAALPPLPSTPPLAASPTPVPPPPRMLSGAFPILAIGGTRVRGLVQVGQRPGGGFDATVSVSGLPAGMPTLHTVHIHRGSCANPYAGAHQTVLGILGASATGVGAFSAPIAPTYLASGHYVIVYMTAAARTIVGCANLGPLA